MNLMKETKKTPAELNLFISVMKMFRHYHCFSRTQVHLHQTDYLNSLSSREQLFYRFLQRQWKC